MLTATHLCFTSEDVLLKRVENEQVKMTAGLDSAGGRILAQG